MTADDTGGIADTFDLPNWFVAEYSVTATGASGDVARTTFTDGNVTFALASDSTGIVGGSVTWTRYSNSACTADPKPGGPTLMGGNAGAGNDHLKTNVVTPPSGYSFVGWSTTANDTSLSSSLCVDGGPNPTIYAHFRATTVATSLTTSAASGTYGGTVSLSATLTGGSAGVSGKTVSFKLNGTSVGTATTNSLGVASLASASLAGINAGAYPGGVEATFVSEPGFTGSTGTNSLTIAKKNQTIEFAAPTGVTFGDADSELVATATSGLAVGYASSTTSNCTIVSAKLHVVGAGTCTVTASQAGNGNYNAATPVERSFVVEKADATVSITWATPQTYNGSNHPATAQVDGVGGDSDLSPAATLEYFSGDTAGTAGTGSATAPTNAGDYSVRASFAGNGNYNSDTAVKSIVIEKAAQATLTVTSPDDGTYGDKLVPASGGGSGDGAESFTASGTACEMGTGVDAGKLVITSGTGTCSVTAHKAGNVNYNSTDSAAHAVTIHKAAQATLTVTSPDDGTYGDKLVPASGGGSGDGAESFTASGTACEMGTGVDAGKLVITSGTGTCSVTAHKAGNVNYNSTDSAAHAVTIHKAARRR